VIALVIRSGKVLMVKRGDAPHRGLWTLPGGHLEFGEQLQEAAARETREETGVDVKVTRFDSFTNVVVKEGKRSFHIVLFCYLGYFQRGTLMPGLDVTGAKWVRPNELSQGKIAPPVRRILRRRGFLT
jgi:ADP-ribose pyrophosphatase